jgi:hypothetical protein
MKYAISFLITMNAWCAPIRVFYEGQTAYAERMKLTLIQGYSIPEDLIQTQKVGNCSELKEQGKLDICLNRNGDLLLVSVDRQFVSESLKIFRAP